MEKPDMSTRKRKKAEDFSLESLGLVNKNSDLLESVKHKLASTAPPNLKKSDGPKKCDNCANFSYVSGRAHSGDGECSAYRTFVHAGFYCDSWETSNE